MSDRNPESDHLPALSVTEIANRLLVGLCEMRCEACGCLIHVPVDYAATNATCPDCRTASDVLAEIEKEARKIRGASIHDVEGWLQQRGMTGAESAADMHEIPPKLRAALMHPELKVTAIMSGHIPSRGFGLTGSVGIGKTYALSAIFKTCAWVRITRRDGHEGKAAIAPWLEWVNWHRTADAIRVASAGIGGIITCSSMAERMRSANALILDDLGSERMNKAQGDDYATSLLHSILNVRYESGRPTWFTTNLDAAGLVARYGSRMISRLVGRNVLVQCPAGPDMRMNGGRS